jgi:hypothetical protein
MEKGLKLMPSVCADRMDAKRKSVNNIVDEVDCIRVCMSGVYFQCLYACSVVNCGVLESVLVVLVSSLVAEETNVKKALSRVNRKALCSSVFVSARGSKQ